MTQEQVVKIVNEEIKVILSDATQMYWEEYKDINIREIVQNFYKYFPNHAHPYQGFIRGLMYNGWVNDDIYWLSYFFECLKNKELFPLIAIKKSRKRNVKAREFVA